MLSSLVLGTAFGLFRFSSQCRLSAINISRVRKYVINICYPALLLPVGNQCWCTDPLSLIRTDLWTVSDESFRKDVTLRRTLLPIKHTLPAMCKTTANLWNFRGQSGKKIVQWAFSPGEETLNFHAEILNWGRCIPFPSTKEAKWFVATSPQMSSFGVFLWQMCTFLEWTLEIPWEPHIETNTFFICDGKKWPNQLNLENSGSWIRAGWWSPLSRLQWMWVKDEPHSSRTSGLTRASITHKSSMSCIKTTPFLS